MSKQTDASFFIVSSVPALYQRLLSGVANHQELAHRVLRQIKVAHTFRQVERVKELARLLSNVPIKEFQLIAQYYLVWCKCRELEYHPDILERVAEQTRTYKAPALISRAALEVYQGKVEPALYFYTEALKANPTISDFVHASVGIAIVKSMEGFGTLAIEDIENLIPLLPHAEPLARLTAINAYAVELNATDRLTEAQAVSVRAMSSPLAPFYPELRETLSNVESKRRLRSTVAISRPQIEYKPEREVPGNPLSKARVQTVVGFMRTNMHRSISLDELAKLVNLSRSQFSHMFKTETGISPMNYLIRLRIEKAAELLTTTFLKHQRDYGNGRLQQ